MDPEMNRTSENAPSSQPGSYRKGGKVRESGYAKLHKGERVVQRKGQKNARKTGRR